MLYHHNTMTSMETARALSKLLNSNGVRIAVGHPPKGDDLNYSRLSRELGKSETFIRNHLDLLTERPEVQEWLNFILKQLENNFLIFYHFI